MVTIYKVRKPFITIYKVTIYKVRKHILTKDNNPEAEYLFFFF